MARCLALALLAPRAVFGAESPRFEAEDSRLDLFRTRAYGVLGKRTVSGAVVGQAA